MRREESSESRRSDALHVVASERHVERMAREGRAVETRAHLRTRLFDAFVPDVVLATRLEARLVLGAALAETAGRDPLLAPVARKGGEAWERTIDAIDAAIGVLRAAGVHGDAVGRAAKKSDARARTLAAAMRAVDAALEARGLVDPRGAGVVLAERMAAAPPMRVLASVGAPLVVARFVLDWDGADAAWWRAMDAGLARAGGEGARAMLPSFEHALDASRSRDPLETVIESVARALDAPPMTVPIEPALGDLRLVGAAPPGAAMRASLAAASDAEAQARATVDAVTRALAGGAGVESIAVAAARLDEHAVRALRRAFDDAGIPLYDARGEAPIAAGVVAFAFDALAIGERGLPRLDTAALARSRYVDAARLDATPRALSDLARGLERTATAFAGDPRASLVATARASVEQAPRGEERAALASRLADVLLRAARPATRADHVATTRALLADLGVDPLRGAPLATGALASDAPARGLARAELHAVARDAHAWELFHAALGDYEAGIARLGLAREVASPGAFRHELARTLDARAGRPSAARAGAVRLSTLGELDGETLALLVVVDANEGALPSTTASDALVSDSLASALRAIDPSRAPETATVRAARELASLAIAAAGAASVVLVRRARDEDNAAIAPSPLFAWLERAGAPATTWRASPLDGPPVDAREACLRAPDASPSVARRARIERTREARFESRDPAPDPVLGDLAPLSPTCVAARALADETGAGDRPLGITSLERFATCAFQGYAMQVLRAQARRPVRELPDVRESGSLMHRALAAAFDATRAMWSARPRDEARIRETAADAAERAVRSEAAASSLRRLAMGRVLEHVSAVVEWSLADDAWDFAHAEQTFGDDARASWPPLVLDDGETRVLLRGSIDRVDVGHGRAAVRALDYKSSRRAADSGAKELGETSFQIALYARVASDARSATERTGQYVFAARPADVTSRARSAFEARWTDLHVLDGPLTRIEANAVDVVRRVRVGMIAPRPARESACATCDVSGGCRKPRFAITTEEEDGHP